MLEFAEGSREERRILHSCVRRETTARVLLDHLVRPDEEGLRNGEPEGLRRLNVDHQLERGRLLDGEHGNRHRDESASVAPDRPIKDAPENLGTAHLQGLETLNASTAASVPIAFLSPRRHAEVSMLAW